MSTATMRRHWTPCNETRRSIPRPPSSIELLDIQQGAALVMQECVPQGRAIVGLTSQRMTAARDMGGGLRDVAWLIRCDPMNAGRYLEYLASVHRRVQRTLVRPLRLILLEKCEADAAEDVARDRLRDEETAETLRRAIAAQEEEVARGQALLDSMRDRLAELEAGR